MVFTILSDRAAVGVVVTAWYNEHNPYAAAWLRNMQAAGQISPGTVDERDVQRVPADAPNASWCHWFAGIGGWDLALRWAGWPATAEIWTGSCPCTPFSVAGRQRGTADPRHLWPVWYRHIRECTPPVLVGEQVAGRLGLAWWELVASDLEAVGYAVGAAVLPAAGVGAPHLRARLYWTAIRIPDTNGKRGMAYTHGPIVAGTRSDTQVNRPGVAVTGMGHADGGRRGGNSILGVETQAPPSGPGEAIGHLGDESGAPGADVDWGAVHWVPCADDVERPVPNQPEFYPLAHGLSRGMGLDKPGLGRVVRRAGRNRVGRSRGYGNAVVPAVAAAWVRAVMDVFFIVDK